MSAVSRPRSALSNDDPSARLRLRARRAHRESGDHRAFSHKDTEDLLPDLYELEPLRPVDEETSDGAGRRSGFLEPPRRLPLRDFEQLVVADEIDHPKRRHAGLPRAEEVAGAAQLQVALGDLEA